MTQTKQMRSAGASRDRILLAAKDLFTGQGFEATTIRAIAERAHIHPSLVMRYFESKEKLFLAAVQWDLHLPDLRSVAQGERGCVLIRHFLAEWEGPHPQGHGLPVLLRIALSHPQGPELLLRVFQQQVLPVVAAGGRKGANKRAALIATQLLGLALTRYVLRLPPVVHLSPLEIERNIGATLQRYLDVT